MKSLLLLTLLFSSLTFAHNHDEEGSMKEEKYEKMKERALENVEKRIGQMEKVKSCIKSSSSKEDLKKCRMQARENMKEMREQRHAKRKGKQKEE